MGEFFNYILLFIIYFRLLKKRMARNEMRKNSFRRILKNQRAENERK